MISYDQDPDVVRWGLHQLLDVCSITNAGSQSAVTQYDRDLSQVQYVRECYCQTEQGDVENDAVIAYALQQELSRVAAAEASGSDNPSQESILAQDWLAPSRRYFSSGCENDVEAADFSGENGRETGGSSKQMETGGQSREVKVETDDDEGQVENLQYLLDVTDESSILDCEVGKRLNQMVPVPHVPKINGEIPSADEEISDHQRLLDRLQLYGLIENKVKGDGNCQFRSLSDQLYRSPEHHKFVREQIINQLKSYPEIYEGYVPMAYEDYLKRMSLSGEWGDHVTLQAAADSVWSITRSSRFYAFDFWHFLFKILEICYICDWRSVQVTCFLQD
ncbi:OVARIAN TUMOR DOMAIN-containing deubiquitinating enzyme 9-like isoform X2 [Mangifera indica]|uniref:OVARIAN TUMOR DOMAIN-containing deubiquitinating enzyme 9-like isoform X2 n=1 Tax=Mangifera indica TaxID=29780 RepID=UPI001CFB7612|nr:OVARIAN TUMOR DOMAIN-containing deubiquitinating enzyme 9-like isoform X2 [Mangifera indica]